MTRRYLFADESGNLDFSHRRGATKDFAVATLELVGDDAVEALRLDLLQLQTELAWSGVEHLDGFHASEDPQRVRDMVFAVLRRHPVVVDVTVIEKSKTQPHLRSTPTAFFAFAWRRHLAALAPVMPAADTLMIVVSAVGTRRTRATFRAAVGSAAATLPSLTDARVVFMTSAADPALQAADYLLWAVMRAWDRGDRRSLDPMLEHVRSQVDVFAHGREHYY